MFRIEQLISDFLWTWIFYIVIIMKTLMIIEEWNPAVRARGRLLPLWQKKPKLANIKLLSLTSYNLPYCCFFSLFTSQCVFLVDILKMLKNLRYYLCRWDRSQIRRQWWQFFILGLFWHLLCCQVQQRPFGCRHGPWRRLGAPFVPYRGCTNQSLFH